MKKRREAPGDADLPDRAILVDGQTNVKQVVFNVQSSCLFGQAAGNGDLRLL